MCRTLLIISVALSLVGCRLFQESPKVTVLGVVDYWSTPSYPSLRFEIRSDNSILLHRAFNGKTKRHIFPIENCNIDALLRVAKAACGELQAARPVEHVYDGANIFIQLGGDKANAIVFKHYGKALYSMQNVEAMIRKFEEIVPEKYWNR